MSEAIVLHKRDLDELAELGQALVASGFFRDSTKVAQASVKVLAGREMGLGPVQSMRALHIIEGKIELSADLLAQRVKTSGKYDYRVRELTETVCSIEFFGPRLDGGSSKESLGTATFSIEDAQRAGIVKQGGAWVKYPKAMLFARAISSGVGFYTPDVAGGGGRIYVEGEVGGPEPEYEDEDTVDINGVFVGVQTGEIVDAEIVEDGVADLEPGADQAPSSTPSEPMATKAQLVKLAILAQRFEWDNETRRANAGVSSFTELTKARASDLIEAWSNIEVSLGPGSASTEPEGISVSEAVEDAPEQDGSPAGEAYGEGVDPAGPPNEALIGRAQTKWGTKARVVSQVRRHYSDVLSFEDITHYQLAETLTKALEWGS